MPGWLADATWWLLAGVAVVGAVTAVLHSNPVRMAAGLGAFLIALAGLFLYYAMPFLAVAQVFVYVGGVLVLILFGIMLVTRVEGGLPGLSSRHDLSAAVIALAIPMALGAAFWTSRDHLVAEPGTSGVEAVADILLGPMLPHFEAAGLLLLIALVAVLVAVGGSE